MSAKSKEFVSIACRRHRNSQTIELRSYSGILIIPNVFIPNLTYHYKNSTNIRSNIQLYVIFYNFTYANISRIITQREKIS